MEFVKYDASKPDEMEKYERVIAMIRPKEVGVANLGLLKPSQVVTEVKAKLDQTFLSVRPQILLRTLRCSSTEGAADPTACGVRYCQYDAVHKDYCFRQEWVDFLVGKLQNPGTYSDVISRRKKAAQRT